MKHFQVKSILRRKWAIDILICLSHNKKVSYGTIKHTLKIPNATLAVLLGDFVKCGLLEKFIIGDATQFHYTEYLLSPYRLRYINNLFKIKFQ